LLPKLRTRGKGGARSEHISSRGLREKWERTSREKKNESIIRDGGTAVKR